MIVFVSNSGNSAGAFEAHVIRGEGDARSVVLSVKSVDGRSTQSYALYADEALTLARAILSEIGDKR